jgi:hypothetical protein
MRKPLIFFLICCSLLSGQTSVAEEKSLTTLCKNSESSFLNQPPEIIDKIGDYLPLRADINLSMTCKKMRALVENKNSQRYNNDQLGKDLEEIYFSGISDLCVDLILIGTLIPLSDQDKIDIEDIEKCLDSYNKKFESEVFLQKKDNIKKLKSRIFTKETQDTINLIKKAKDIINKYKSNADFKQRKENDYAIEIRQMEEFSLLSFKEIKKQGKKELRQIKIQLKQIESLLEKSNSLKYIPEFNTDRNFNLLDTYTYLKWDKIRLKKELKFLQNHKREFSSLKTGIDKANFLGNMDREIEKILPIYMDKILRISKSNLRIILDKTGLERYWSSSDLGEYSLKILQKFLAKTEQDLKEGKPLENRGESLFPQILAVLKEIEQQKLEKIRRKNTLHLLYS